MLKISNEVRIALLAIVAIAIGFWGFKFLKGINVLTPDKVYYVKYDRIDLLTASSPVLMKGFQVGMVKEIYIDPETDTSLIVVLNISRSVEIPKSTLAVIVPQSMLGGKAVELVIKQPCSGGDCAPSGSFLQGRLKSFLEQIVGDPTQIDGYTSRLRSGLTINIDSLARANPNGMASTIKSLDHTIENFEALTREMNNLIRQNARSIQQTLDATASLSKQFDAKGAKIGETIDNLTKLSAQLSNAGLDEMSKKTARAIDTVITDLTALRSTLNSSTRAIGRVDSLTQNMLKGKGMAGKVMTDEELYDNLVRTTRQMQLLMQDLRLNPKRYTTLKLKVFGKNKTKGYQNPIDDPAYQHLVDSLETEYSKRLRKN